MYYIKTITYSKRDYLFYGLPPIYFQRASIPLCMYTVIHINDQQIKYERLRVFNNSYRSTFDEILGETMNHSYNFDYLEDTIPGAR